MQRRKVIKSAFGYNDLPANSSKDFTHVIFDREAYQDTLDTKRALENEIKRLERDCDNKIAAYKKSADDEIANYMADADERVKEAESDFLEQKKIAEDYQNRNQHLIKILTERANAKRQLVPKTKYNGYLFLSVEQTTHAFKCFATNSKKRKTTVSLPCFRVRLQSPYETVINFQTASGLIVDDQINKFGYSIGIRSCYQNDFFANNEEYDEEDLTHFWEYGMTNKQKIKAIQEKKEEVRKNGVNLETDDIIVEDITENFIFYTAYKANVIKGFWEVEYLTRFAVDIIPEMVEKMILDNNKKK